MKHNANPANKSVGWFDASTAKTFLRRCWNKLRAFTGDPEPDVEAAMEHPRVLVEPLRADGGIERPPTQGFVREDEAGQYVVCAGLTERGRPCRARMRLDETASTETRWVWTCPDCEERLIQARGGRR